jgi:pilus assembly protein CpaB
VLTPGKKAVTVRVSDIEGVAGFVLPGDRVDIMLTRSLGGERGSPSNSISDVVLQNVRVLAIDQIADDRMDKPAVVKAVTLEVEIAEGQKVSLAASLGTLTLALRQAGDTLDQPSRQITAEDLGKKQKKDGPNGNFSTITVMRGTKKENYSVPAETANAVNNNAVNQGVTR